MRKRKEPRVQAQMFPYEVGKLRGSIHPHRPALVEMLFPLPHPTSHGRKSLPGVSNLDFGHQSLDFGCFVQADLILLDADLVPVEGFKHVVDKTRSTIKKPSPQHVGIEEVDPGLARQAKKQALQKAPPLHRRAEEAGADLPIEAPVTVPCAQQRFPIGVDIVALEMMVKILNVMMDHGRAQPTDRPMHQGMLVKLHIIAGDLWNHRLLKAGQMMFEENKFP